MNNNSFDIIQIDEKNIDLYTNFIQKSDFYSFFQEPIWGDFQVKTHQFKAFLFLGKENSTILNSVLLFQIPLPYKKSYFYAPRGPLLSTNKKANDLFFEKIEEFGRKKNVIFFRFDPLIESKSHIKDLFNDQKLYTSYSNQPNTTIILDLTLSEEELMKQMRPKGRYNIRVAFKKGVKIRKGNIEEFYTLMKETAERDGFSMHIKSVYENMLQVLKDHAVLLTGEYEGKAVTAGIFIVFGKTMMYYYGASGNEHRNVLAPYLLQWEAFKYGKEHGATEYDFLGIADAGAKNHRLASVTEFKRKFGGQIREYVGAWEVRYSPMWCFIYRLYRKFRHIF